MKKKYSILLAALALLSSCSVKEERKECPCILEINTAIAQSGRSVDIAGFCDGERMWMDRFERDSCPLNYERDVRRCIMSVVGVLSDEECVYSNGGRVVPIHRGSQADSLFAGVCRVDASGETASAAVTLHKQFTTVHIRQEQEGEVSCPCIMEVRGDCAGLDVLSLGSVAGEFFYETPFPKEGASFRILRISENSSFWITIKEEATGDALRSFQISSIMKKAGYDCNATDLQDVVITVNLVSMDFGISVEEWSGAVIEADI